MTLPGLSLFSLIPGFFFFSPLLFFSSNSFFPLFWLPIILSFWDLTLCRMRDKTWDWDFHVSSWDFTKTLLSILS